MQQPALLPSTRTLPMEPRLAVEEMHRLGFSHVEVNYASFIHTGLDYPSYPNVLRLTLLQALRAGLQVPVIHAPWEEYFLPYLGRGVDAAVKEAALIAEIASSYGVETMVLHPFSKRRLGSGRAWWLNKMFFSLLAQRIEQEGLGLTVAVENTSRAAPWSSVEETRRLVEAAGSPRLALCLDFGHAGINGYQPGDALEAAGPLTRCLHIHDNNGAADEHLVPGCGSLNWETLAGRQASAAGLRYGIVEVDCRAPPGPCRGRLRVAYEASRLLLGRVIEFK